MSRGINISDICSKHELMYQGKNVLIKGLGLCNRKPEFSSILSYVSNDKYVQNVKDNINITCLVLTKELKSEYSVENIGRNISFIISNNPEIDFYHIHEELCRTKEFYENYDCCPKIGNNCRIAPSAVIENGVIIGNNVTVGANTVVKAGSIIDDNTTIGCNTIIGSEGFQLIIDGENTPLHITHVGRCHIGSNVYIGDNTCVCNGLFDEETHIDNGAKIDNLVHIAHNLYVGKNAVITAHVAICGSARIEEGAWISPNSSILNRVKIGKGAKVGLGSVVTRDVAPYTVVYGSPAKEHK